MIVELFLVERVTIPIASGLNARGLLFIPSPKGNRASRGAPASLGEMPATIICPDADTWPERVAQSTSLLDGVAVSIISGNFNDWRTKITSDEKNTSYLRHPDEDMSSWNCLNRFTHPELIAMMIPRPVAIEYGNRDGITTPEWTAYAWNQTKKIRDHLGQTDRIQLFEFDGPHEIHGIETFKFLDRWLKPGS